MGRFHIVLLLFNITQYYLLPALDPNDFHLLPDIPSYRHIKQEALQLLHNGRCLYFQPPSTIPTRDNSSELSPIDEIEESSHASNEFLQAMLKQKHTSSVTPSYFVQDNINDIITMLYNQNRLAKRLYHDEQIKKSGLTILRQNSNTSLASNASTTMLQKALTSLSSFKTLSKYTSAAPEKQEKRFISDLPYRHITELSTRHNLKYMKLGDNAITQLCKPLDNNRLIEKIVLSNAHLTDVGARALIAILHRIHSLHYLDLSQNGLTDAAACALASAAKICVSLKKVTLAANRLTVEGIEALIRCLYDSPLIYLK